MARVDRGRPALVGGPAAADEPRARLRGRFDGARRVDVAVGRLVGRRGRVGARRPARAPVRDGGSRVGARAAPAFGGRRARRRTRRAVAAALVRTGTRVLFPDRLGVFDPCRRLPAHRARRLLERDGNPRGDGRPARAGIRGPGALRRRSRGVWGAGRPAARDHLLHVRPRPWIALGVGLLAAACSTRAGCNCSA